MKQLLIGSVLSYKVNTTSDKFNLYGMGGISTIGYSYLDHFGGEWESGLGTKLIIM